MFRWNHKQHVYKATNLPFFCEMICASSVITHYSLRGAGDDMILFHCALSWHQGHKMHNNLKRWQLCLVMPRLARHMCVSPQLERLLLWLVVILTFRVSLWQLPVKHVPVLFWMWEGVKTPDSTISTVTILHMVENVSCPPCSPPLLTFDYIRLWATNKWERPGLHKAQGLMALLVTSPVIHDRCKTASWGLGYRMLWW